MYKEYTSIDNLHVNVSEIHKLADKQKWMKRFINAYKGDVKNSFNFTGYYGENVRFFVAHTLEFEMGFVRINDKSSLFNKSCSFKVWNLTDGYVKPPYRSIGVLKKLIEHVVKECDVRMMYIETERFSTHLNYYKMLGFNNHYTVENGHQTWAFQDDIWPYVVEMNNRKT